MKNPLKLSEPREPICGEDFCEDCGDCLYCQGGQCGGDETKEHNNYQLWFNRDEDGELLDKPKDRCD